MANLQTMYPGVANSPDTFLVEGLAIDGTVMYVADGAVFGEIPTLAVIGQTELAETVQITGKQSDGGYTIIRGVEGKRQAWAKATNVARNWTNKDYEALRANITEINDGKVDKVAGKGLSTNDYDATAKAKVDAIPPDPKYTDTVPDLTPYAKTTDLSTEREERKADIAKVRSDHAKDIKTTKDAFTANLQRLESQKLNKTDVVNDLTTGGADKALSAEQGKTLEESKLDKVSGKGLSTNDYTDAAKAKVDAIPPDPKYTDTVPDLSPYAKKVDVPTKQLLYDIFMGESLVTRKEGEWPVVHGKPTSIGVEAFKDNELISVVIPPSVTGIGYSAFEWNKLTNVVIPPSVTSIGHYAFNGNKLTSIVIPPSVTSLGHDAFSGNKLTSVIIPPSVTSIGSWTFANNELTEVTIPLSITSIGDNAFQGNNLMNVVIPPSVASIGDSAFRSNKLTSVTIPSSVTSIGEYAFYNNQLTAVKVPKNCTVGNEAFDIYVNIIRY